MMRKVIPCIILAFAVMLSCFAVLSTDTAAEEAMTAVQGNIYKFEAKNAYEFSSSESSGLTTNDNSLGALALLGDVCEDASESEIQNFSVSTGELSISYQFNSKILNAKEDEWHITGDNSKKVDGVALNDKIMSGALIVQSSSDGEKWVTDRTLTDVFKDKATLEATVYTCSDIQLENGCYFRIIVVYELQRISGEKKIAFLKTDVKEEQKIAEVYQFYAQNENLPEDFSSISDEPRKEIASKSVRTEKDKGYSGSETIDGKDPHFGWKLGSFVINGYTRETSYNGNTVYLKNVGDKVTLWFTLNQDISCLNGNEALSIAEDNDGYDEYFGVAKTNFGHGTLIISYTDYQGNTADPIIYTNFLEANASTKSDTRVRLFEEGDYEVTLDYKIKNSPRQVGALSVLPEYTDYKITFSFSIRNGNCMVFPFDLRTGAELYDGDLTRDGFKLDAAKSRYLEINIKRSVLNETATGEVVEEIRFNGPAKDGETFNKEGIYHFTVKNIYTGEENTKTIYVGTDKYVNAMASDNLTVDDVNTQIAQGVAFEEVVVDPTSDEEPMTTKVESTSGMLLGIAAVLLVGAAAALVIRKRKTKDGKKS